LTTNPQGTGFVGLYQVNVQVPLPLHPALPFQSSWPLADSIRIQPPSRLTRRR